MQNQCFEILNMVDFSRFLLYFEVLEFSTESYFWLGVCVWENYTRCTTLFVEFQTRTQKRGRSPASSNNNSLNQRDNNNKRSNYGTTNGTTVVTQPTQHGCELCERAEFATDAELQAHKKLVHTPVKLQTKSLTSLSMTCAYCGEVCRSRSELETHTRIQHASNEPGGRHKCNICDEVCPSGGILAEHKLQKHCKIQLSDNCIVCRGSLASEAQFMEHVQRHSLESSDPQQRLDNALPHLPAGCVVCRQTLISDLECRLHARHHLRGFGCPQNSNTSPSPNQQKIQGHQQIQQAALSCCLCLREFGADDFVSLPSNPAVASGPPLRVCKSCYVRHSQGLPILSSPYEHVRPSKSDMPGWPVGKDHNSWDGSRDNWDSERFFKGEKRGTKKLTKESSDIRCEECGIKFENFEEAENHRNKEHGKSSGNSNTYTCIQCQVRIFLFVSLCYKSNFEIWAIWGISNVYQIFAIIGIWGLPVSPITFQIFWFRFSFFLFVIRNPVMDRSSRNCRGN